MINAGRGIYDSYDQVLISQNRLHKAMQEVANNLNADDVFIPFDVGYATCGWKFSENKYKPLIECDRAELEVVCKKLFRRCQVLQYQIDKEEEKKIRAAKPNESETKALELMR